MNKFILFSILLLSFNIFISAEDTVPANFKFDDFSSGKDVLKIYLIGHGTLMIEFNKLIIHIDPVKRYADYDKLPQADLILITHDHGDHLDKETIQKLTKKQTKLILNKASFDKIQMGNIMKNGETTEFLKIKIEAVPAYNTTLDRDKYHTKGNGNGYILTLGSKRIYIAGDTEDIPEMANFKNIDIAFLPMNQPYTMLPEQVVKAVNMIKPKIVYPYHFGETDVNLLINLMKDIKDVELRIRDLK